MNKDHGGSIRTVLFALIASLAASTNGHAAHADRFAIVHVNVVPMDREVVLRDRTVLVVGGVIQAVDEEKSVRIPKGTVRIEGRGKYLIPGLADMHVHIGAEVPGMGLTLPDPINAKIAGSEWDGPVQRELLLYLANGVTTVRNMAGSPTTLRLIHRIESGELRGPRVFTAGPIIDGNPPSNPVIAFHVFDQPQEAAQLVESLHQQGYSFLKVYNQLSAESYYALADAAHAAGMPVVGHVPFKVGFPGVLQAHQDSVEHLRGYDFDASHPPTVSVSADRFNAWFRISDETMRENAVRTAAAGIYNCPTLSVIYDGMVTGAAKTQRAARPEMQLMPEALRAYTMRDVFPDAVAEAYRRTVPQQQKMIKALSDAGAPLMAGTDSPLALAVPGFELHREIELLAQTGLTPYQALRSATATSQEFLQNVLHDGAHRGVIAAGFDADLVLIGGDPLADPANTRHISGVMVRGKWYSAEELRL